MTGNHEDGFCLLQALKAAPTGVYCGPLRLLAMEVYDSLNASGTYCNLITGEPRPATSCKMWQPFMPASARSQSLICHSCSWKSPILPVGQCQE